jgi:hypothetical protein
MYKTWQFIEIVIKKYTTIDTIISGGADGVDSFAKEFAKTGGLSYIEFPADWETHGKSAGFIRNVDIVKNADVVLAIWDGYSAGTKHSFQLAKDHNKLLIVYNDGNGTVSINDYRPN